MCNIATIAKDNYGRTNRLLKGLLPEEIFFRSHRVNTLQIKEIGSAPGKKPHAPYKNIVLSIVFYIITLTQEFCQALFSKIYKYLL